MESNGAMLSLTIIVLLVARAVNILGGSVSLLRQDQVKVTKLMPEITFFQCFSVCDF
jgi:hypothetical protein